MNLLDLLKRKKLAPPKNLSLTVPSHSEFHGFITPTITRSTPPPSTSSGPMTLRQAIEAFVSRNSSLLNNGRITDQFVAANPQFKGASGYYFLGFGAQGRPIIDTYQHIPDEEFFGASGKPINGKQTGNKPADNWPKLNGPPATPPSPGKTGNSSNSSGIGFGGL